MFVDNNDIKLDFFLEAGAQAIDAALSKNEKVVLRILGSLTDPRGRCS